MPLTSIVVAVLRLFAIHTALLSLNTTLTIAGSMARGRFESPDYARLSVPLAMFIFAVLEWCLAPLVAAAVTRRHNGTVSLGAVSRLDLYSFAFVFLGLYYILESLASSLNWLHYFLAISAVGSQAESESSFYDLARHLVTLFAGIASLVWAPRWARKLASAQHEDEAA